MGVANKAISVAEINKQLVAVRAAAMIDTHKLIKGIDIYIEKEFEASINFIKENKIKSHIKVLI
jgi:hypothetical protein